jgi:hypothetical protein
MEESETNAKISLLIACTEQLDFMQQLAGCDPGC